jgi:hypothetical protein
MKEKIKKIVVILSLCLTIAYGVIDVTYGVYFGVLTNVLINAFWNSKLFPEKKFFNKKNNTQLIVENIRRPRF